MNKSELLKAIAAKSGLTITDSGKALDGFIESIAEALKEGDKVQLVGFGTFEVKSRDAREGINPATKEKIKIAASKSPSLKFGKTFKDQF